MTNRTFAPIRGRVMRVTELDGCGRIKAGACTSITTDGFVTVTATARNTEPTVLIVQVPVLAPRRTSTTWSTPSSPR